MDYVAVSTGAVTALWIGLSILSFGVAARKRDLKVVHDDKGSKTTVDIVCVHGPGGHPDKTWTSPETRVNWLTDILPGDVHEHSDVDIRVMTYDYHAESESSASFPAFLQRQSRRLITQLAHKRGQDARDRPLVFIAHSLGGLIVRDALVYSSASEVDKDTRFKSIQLSTIGVLYFGTPNRDGQKLQWSKLINQVMSASGTDVLPSGLDPLLRQDELFRLELDRYKSIEDKFKNVVFYETVRTTVDKGKEEIHIVPQMLTLPLHKFDWWESHGLNRTHHDLCKFESKNDDDYQLVSNALHDCLKDSMKAANHRVEFDQNRHGDHNEVSVPDNETEDLAPMFWRVQSFPSRSIKQEYSAVKSKVVMLEQKLQRRTYSAKEFDNEALQLGIQLIELYDDMLDSSKVEIHFNKLKKMTKNQLNHLEAEYGYRDRRPLRLTTDLARLYAAAGYPSKSECLNRRLLVVVQDLFGYTSLPSAFVLNQLAHDAHYQGDYDRAVVLLRRVLKIQNAQYTEGERHPETLRTIARLAIIRDQQKKFTEAQKLYHQVIRCREELPSLGRLHPETLKAMENLALSYRLQGKHKLPDSVKTYEDVLSRRKEVLSRCPNSGTVDTDLREMTDDAVNLYRETMIKLLDVLGEQKEFEKAMKIEDEWSDLQEKKNFGPALFAPSGSIDESSQIKVGARGLTSLQDTSDRAQCPSSSDGLMENKLQSGPRGIPLLNDDDGSGTRSESVDHVKQRDLARLQSAAGEGAFIAKDMEGFGSQFASASPKSRQVRFEL